MAILIRLVAAYLVLLAVAIAALFIITPLYHPGGDEPYPIWEVLNWFMAVGIVLALAAGYAEKRRADGDGAADLRRYLAANTIFYATAALLIVFFWNWFSVLSPDNTPDGQFWVVINTLMPIVIGAAGCRAWRNAAL